MAATGKIQEHNGAGPSATDKTSGTIRFKLADNATVDLSNPIPIPTASTNESFKKSLRANFTGSFTQITNVEAYSDGSNGWTGVNLYYNTVATYAQATAAATGTGDGDFFGAVAATPVDLQAGTVTGTGDAGRFLELWISVGTSASQGVLASETLTLSWSEI